MTVNWGRRPQILCCKSHVFVKSINCKKTPMLLKAQAFCLSPPEVTSPLVAERLGMFIDTCKVLTGDLWVLQAVKGFKILFVSSTSQDTMPTKLVFPPEQEAQMKELRLLLEKEAIAPVTNSQGGFYSNLFGTQEERSDKASNQPETVERVGNHRTFQYGRGLNPEGHPTIGGLVHEGRSERCLLHNSHRLWPPAVPEVLCWKGRVTNLHASLSACPVPVAHLPKC